MTPVQISTSQQSSNDSAIPHGSVPVQIATRRATCMILLLVIPKRTQCVSIHGQLPQPRAIKPSNHQQGQGWLTRVTTPVRMRHAQHSTQRTGLHTVNDASPKPSQPASQPHSMRPDCRWYVCAHSIFVGFCQISVGRATEQLMWIDRRSR